MSRRLALVCDGAGRVESVLRDDLHVASDAPGRPLAGLVAPGSGAKCFALLAELHKERALFGWDLAVLDADGEFVPLHFAGAQQGDRILLVASDEASDVVRFNEELAHVHSEQVNELRQVIGERTRFRPGPDGELLDRLAAVDNDLLRAQRELAKRNVDLARLTAERSMLVAMAVHDIRSPLTVIQGFVALLREDPAVPDRHAETLREIERACDGMGRLTADLLDWSRLEAVEIQLQREPIDLGAVAEICVHLHQIVANRRGVRIDFAVDAPLPLVPADPIRIGEVVSNLLSNAVRFTAPNSAVGVQLRRVGEEIELTVSDAGPGLAAQEIERLFQPYERDGARRDERGWGLGLAVVQRLLTAHGGRIEVESGEHGTRFHVRLPLEADVDLAAGKDETEAS